MLSDKKLIIFDMDGTILNTIDDLANCTNYALEKCGYKRVSNDFVKKYTGRGVNFMLEHCMPDGSTEAENAAVFRAFKPYYKEHCNDFTRPYDGICDVIKRIKDAGYKTAVLSNKIQFAVEDLCKLWFDGLFDGILGNREGIATKPSPEGVNFILNELRISPEDAVLVGDSEIDIQTGYNADLTVVGVEWGFRDRSVLEDMGVENIISKPDELLDLLDIK